MGKSDEKNFGPHIVAMMLGTCIGSYIEYGVTRKELVRMVKDQYDGIVATLKQQGIQPGFGKLSDEQLLPEIDKLKHKVLTLDADERLGWRQALAEGIDKFAEKIRGEM